MAMPRRARAGGSSRSATRLRAPRGSPAARARAARATRESMSGRIHVAPVRRSTGYGYGPRQDDSRAELVSDGIQVVSRGRIGRRPRSMLVLLAPPQQRVASGIANPEG